MARGKKAKSVWSAEGKSVEDLIKMGSDYNRYKRLSEPTLRKVMNRLASAANKRLRRMEAAGEASPAYREVQASGGKFSTKGKTLEGLQKEFLRVKQFFEDKTSSLQFWRTAKNTATYRAERDKVVVPPDPAKPAAPSQPAAPSPAVPDEPPEMMPPQMKYREVQEDGSILLEDGTVYYPDQGQIINPDTGEIMGFFHGSQNRDKYAVDSPGYSKIVGDIWEAVDDLIAMDPAYRDRAFRYEVYDAIEQEYLSDQDQGVTLEEIKARLGERMDTLHRARMEQIGEATRHGVSTFFEE